MMQKRPWQSLSFLAWIGALACGPDGAPPAAESDESDGSGTETGAPETTVSATSTAATTSTGPDPSGTDGTTGDTDDTDDTTEGSTGDEPPDAYGGVWCGLTSSDRLTASSASSIVRFGASHGGPRAFAGWVTDGGELQVAAYEVASASWGEPTTLETGISALFGTGPVGGVDDDGNAFVAYVRAAPEQQVVVQAYDGATDTWTESALTGDFVALRIGAMTMTRDGHAVLSAYDNVGPVQVTSPVVWFRDGATEEWSDANVYAPVDQLFSIDTLLWSYDPDSGDAALALAQDGGTLLLQHHDAETGTLETLERDHPGHTGGLRWIGDDQFVLLTSTGGYEQSTQIFAHHFDGSEWQPTAMLASGYYLTSIRLTARSDGRAVASWQDPQWGTYLVEFQRERGWGDMLTADAPDPGGFDAWSSHTVALDDEGLFVAWSTFQSGSSQIHTWARRLDGDTWGDPVELDPMQGEYHSRIALLQSLGTDRARAIWARDSEISLGGYFWACHTPVGGWSEPQASTDTPLYLSPQPDDGLLMVGLDASNLLFADYFVAK